MRKKCAAVHNWCRVEWERPTDVVWARASRDQNPTLVESLKGFFNDKRSVFHKQISPCALVYVSAQKSELNENQQVRETSSPQTKRASLRSILDRPWATDATSPGSMPAPPAWIWS